MSSEDSFVNSRMLPQVLVSKMSLLAAKCENIFQGEVQLGGEHALCDCQLKDRVLRLERYGRLLYFIEL